MDTKTKEAIIRKAAGLTDYAIDNWRVDAVELTDGSFVHNVVGFNGDARVTFYCNDSGSAQWMCETLNSLSVISGCVAESLVTS